MRSKNQGIVSAKDEHSCAVYAQAFHQKSPFEHFVHDNIWVCIVDLVSCADAIIFQSHEDLGVYDEITLWAEYGALMKATSHRPTI